VLAAEALRLAWGALLAHRLRSALTMLGILIGIASVILLTSIGEGTRRYVLSEFTQFGTNVMAINPGKTATSGAPGALSATIRKLMMGMARVEAGERGRSVYVYGVNSEVPEVWKFGVRQGTFLPPGDPRHGAPLAVLGPKLKREIFGERNALGRYVRVGDMRMQVIGVMAPKGLLLGFDIDDAVYIPVASAQRLFNRDELVEIDVLFSQNVSTGSIVEGVRELLAERHDGEEDFTITTQTEMLDVLDRVMGVVSLSVSAIGAISLVVGAIGILTMMWIAVNERTAEIGLAKAIGAGAGQILGLFLLEAALLALAGGLLGVAVGMGIARAARLLLPGLPVHTAPGYVIGALLVSLAVGLLSGALPARRAARLDPVQALHAE
jgi:putative ABC transport system permease protein